MKAVEVKFEDLDEDIEAVKITTVDGDVIYVTYDGNIVK